MGSTAISATKDKFKLSKKASSCSNTVLAKGDEHVLTVVASGLDGKCNKVVYRSPQENFNPHCHVICFPGDVQREYGLMLQSRTSRKWLSYSVESTALILANKFRGHHIWVIMPSMQIHDTFSCYDNFCNHVDQNSNGAIFQYDSDGHACQHLLKLLKSSVECVEKSTGCSPDLSGPITLVGFSKGGVVLNQLITELDGYYQQNGSQFDPLEYQCKNSNSEQSQRRDSRTLHLENKQYHENAAHELFSRVSAIHWLDAGNGPLRGSMPQNPRAISKLASYGIPLVLHGTPYQWNNMYRPWLAEEKNDFIFKVEENGGHVRCRSYFKDEIGTLKMHFKLLHVFQTDKLE